MACGVTFFCHPSNFRPPQPIRTHPEEPFFCHTPQQVGAMEIVSGRPCIARHRMIVADGEPDAQAAAKWAEEYAKLK